MNSANDFDLPPSYINILKPYKVAVQLRERNAAGKWRSVGPRRTTTKPNKRAQATLPQVVATALRGRGLLSPAGQ